MASAELRCFVRLLQCEIYVCRAKPGTVPRILLHAIPYHVSPHGSLDCGFRAGTTAGSPRVQVVRNGPERCPTFPPTTLGVED